MSQIMSLIEYLIPTYTDVFGGCRGGGCSSCRRNFCSF